MKKILALVLAIMMVLALVACGTSETSSKVESNATVETSSKVESNATVENSSKDESKATVEESFIVQGMDDEVIDFDDLDD